MTDDIGLFLDEYSGQVPKELSPLVLAYIGDAVFELITRLSVLNLGNRPVNLINKDTRNIVNAKAQSEMYFRIKDSFTEEETTIFKRGRNAKSFTSPKNADIIDYRHATGLEAVFGYLYLTGNAKRALELFNLGTKEN